MVMETQTSHRGHQESLGRPCSISTKQRHRLLGVWPEVFTGAYRGYLGIYIYIYISIYVTPLRLYCGLHRDNGK